MTERKLPFGDYWKLTVSSGREIRELRRKRSLFIETDVSGKLRWNEHQVGVMQYGF